MIEAEKDTLSFSVDDEIEKGSVSVSSTEEGDEIVANVAEPVKLSFALRYLNMFLNQVAIYLNPKSPIIVEYKIEKL